MKTVTTIIIISFFAFGLISSAMAMQQTADQSELIGKWMGELDAQGQKLKLIFRVTQNDNKDIVATFDSPAQGAMGIPVTSVVVEEAVVIFNVAAAGAKIEGILNKSASVITGYWIQGVNKLPLILTRQTNVEDVTEISSRPIRPQNPKPPFNYVVKEVFVENTDASITLAGTLTLPSDMGKFPAVVLITGSGPQDRDQTFMGHKTFWVLADYLTQKGIAVLRLDDRGVGQSTGNFPTATSVDFAQDISFAVDFLLTHKNINNRRIGLIGHSEGGLIAPITAQMNENVAFIAMLAGPGKTGHDIAVTQIKTILMANGVSETAAMAGSSITESLNQTVINNADPSLLEDELLDTYKRVWVGLTQDAKNELLALGGGKLSEARIAQLSSSWTKYFLAHNPADFLNKLTIPILALHGSKDTQMEADENLRLIKRAFSINQNRSSRVQKIAGVNHLFQNAGTGGMNEYAQITETMSPKVLKIIAAWVLETSK